MALSRKYYREIANILGSSKDLQDATLRMSEYLYNDNPGFKETVFLKAVADARNRMGETNE